MQWHGSLGKKNPWKYDFTYWAEKHLPKQDADWMWTFHDSPGAFCNLFSYCLPDCMPAAHDLVPHLLLSSALYPVVSLTNGQTCRAMLQRIP